MIFSNFDRRTVAAWKLLWRLRAKAPAARIMNSELSSEKAFFAVRRGDKNRRARLLKRLKLRRHDGPPTT